MVKKNNNKNQAQFGLVKPDDNIPKDHISRFVVDFVEEIYDSLKIPDNDKKRGRASFPVQSMLKLLVYATLDHKISARVIAEMVEFHMVYIYVCDGLKPSERTIQRYRKKYGPYYNRLLQMTLKKAADNGFTEFNHVCIDGTIKKAYNSKNNVINRKEVKTLIQHLKGAQVSEKKLKKLHKPAQKILKNKNIDNYEKLELLYDIETQFEFTGQNTIPMNDIEARWMKNKKGNQEISYNIQSAVDYDTKMICAINVVQSPTDHYQLPEISDKAIENIKSKPENISTDTIYLNQISLTYLADNQIKGLIPTRKQSKQITGRLNKNPFHKDHFEYISEKDVFKCPNNKYLYFYKQYVEKNSDEKKYKKVKRLYSNYTACKHCEFLKECTSPKTTHRTITEYGDNLKKAMYEKMETREAKQEYKKRKSVEGPFGTLKEEYLIEKHHVLGVKETEELITLDAVAYNIKRLYNIQQKIKNRKQDLIDFCESTSAQNQLELNVTIL